MRRVPTGLALVAGLVAVIAVVPVVHLVLRAGEAAAPLEIVFSDRTGRFVWATLRLAALVTVAAVVIGVGIAWLVERTALPARRALGLLAILPLVVPTYVGATALVSAVGPRGFWIEAPALIGFWGSAVVLTFSTYPYVMLPARAALAMSDPALEEVARGLGSRPAAIFGRVVLPQLRPAAAAGGLLVFLYVLSDFGAVSIMRYDTLTRGIFVEYEVGFDRSVSAVLGVLLVVLTVAAVLGERAARGRAAPRRAVAGQRRPRLLPLGYWRWPAFAGVSAVVVAGIGLPVAVLVYWVTVGASGSGAASGLVTAASTSVALSAAAAAAAVVMSVPVAIVAVRFRSAYSRTVEAMATSGYALPGIVIGLALVFFASRYAGALYQTYSLIVFAYVIRFLPESLGAVRSSLLGVDPALEDVGRSLGRSRLAVLGTVTLPLVRNGVAAGAALVFLTAMKELPATLVLQPPGATTLATRVWTGSSAGFYAQAAPAALLIVVVSALVLWPLGHERVRTWAA